MGNNSCHKCGKKQCSCFKIYTKKTITNSLSGDGSMCDPLMVDTLISPSLGNIITKKKDGLYASAADVNYGFANVGNGSRVFKDVVENVARFRTLTQGSGIVIQEDEDEIIISSNAITIISTEDTDSISLTGDGSALNPLSANIKLADIWNNAITIETDGLYVPDKLVFGESGLSYITSGVSTSVVLGQNPGQTGSPAKLINTREIPLNNNHINFISPTNSKSFSIRGTGSEVLIASGTLDGFIRINMSNSHTGGAAGNGMLFTNDVGSIGQIYKGSNANGFGGNCFLIRTSQGPLGLIAEANGDTIFSSSVFLNNSANWRARLVGTTGNFIVGVTGVDNGNRLQVIGTAYISSMPAPTTSYSVVVHEGNVLKSVPVSSITSPPASPDRSIQFNNSGAFGGDPNFTYTTDGRLLLPAFNTTNSNVQIGSLETQSYSLNNSWIGENIYYDGTTFDFKYRNTGAAGLFYFAGSEGQFRFYNSGSAGSPITNFNPQFKVNASGIVAIGGSMTNATADYTDAALVANGAGKVSIGATTPPPSADKLYIEADGDSQLNHLTLRNISAGASAQTRIQFFNDISNSIGAGCALVYQPSTLSLPNAFSIWNYDGPIMFATLSSYRGMITNSGNWLVGSSTVDNGNKLQVNGAASINDGIILNGTPTPTSDINVLYNGVLTSTVGIIAGANRNATATNGSYFILRGNDYTAIANQRGNVYLGAGTPISSPSSTEGAVHFLTADITRMSILRDGKVGIGTTTVDAAVLQVQKDELTESVTIAVRNANPSSQVRYQLWNDVAFGASTRGATLFFTSSNYFAGYNNTVGFYNYENGHILFGTNAAERARITAGGNFIVGSAVDIGSRLQVRGNGGLYVEGTGGPSDGITVKSNSGSSYSNITLSASSDLQILLTGSSFTPSGALGANTACLLNYATGGILFSNANPSPFRFYADGGGTSDLYVGVGKVGVNTETVDPSAVMQIESTTAGFLPPRMTTTERDTISSPAAGLVIYNTTTNKHQGWNGSAWNDFY